MNRTGSKILHGMLLATSAMVASPVIVSTAAMANPTGGTVAVGSATITNPSATQTVIDQSSKRALINWNSFNIGAGSSVVFNQPNSKSLTVNRVTGPGSSTIDGSLFANGNIWLLNANGILFGKGSQINVGSILATTSELSDADFKAGNNNFTASPNPNASVINQGTITASRGGSVVLSAPSVSNEGMIQADLGTVVLGGAQAFTVDMTGDNLLRYEIAAPVTQTPTNANGTPALALVSNSGTIAANGGHVVMTARAAQNVEDNVINNTGMVEATSVSSHDGEIDLDAGPDGTTSVGGTLDASGSGNGQTGGTVTVTGGTVNVADGAKINVSGNAGGGTVMIGGGPHGTGSLAHAQRTIIGAATIDADATGKGDGGNVTVWSDGTTQFNGTITSRGGAQGGNGGQVETSGHNVQLGSAATVNTLAPLGLTGDWLLDPSDILITNCMSQDACCGSGPTCISPSCVTSDVESSDLTLTADNTLTVDTNSDITYSSSYELSLVAGTDMTINSVISNCGTGTISLTAGSNNAGNLTLNSGITAANLLLSANGTITQGTSGLRVGTLTANATGDITLTAAGAGEGNQITGIVGLSSTGGNVAFTNTETTWLGKVYANGTFYIGTTDNNQDVADNGHAQLIITQTVTADGAGNSTLHAAGDLVNDPFSDPFHPYADPNPNVDTTIAADALNMISDNGSVGGFLPGPVPDGDYATSYLFGISVNSLHASTGSSGGIEISGDKSFVIGVAGDGTGLNVGTGGGYIGAAVGTMTQMEGADGKILGSNLSFGATSGYTLNNTGNEVGGDLTLYAGQGQSNSFTNNGDTTIHNISQDLFNTTTTGGNITLTVLNGSVSQDGAVYADNLTVSALAGEGHTNPITLTNTSNKVTGTFSAIGSEIAFTNNGTITLGEVHGGVSTCGSSPTTYYAGNVTIVASNGSINIAGNVLSHGESDDATISLTASGNITQGHNDDLDGDSLFLSGGNITLLNDNDIVGPGMVNITATGNVAFGNNDDTVLGATSVAGNLSVLSEGNLTVTSNISNAGNGSIQLVAGWDGHTAPANITSSNNATYGGDGGSVLINAEAGHSISVGNAHGTTSVYGHDVTVSASEGGSFAQLGDAAGGNGTINVYARHDISITSTNSEGTPSYAMIGNGRSNVSSAVGGNITLNAGHDVVLSSGESTFAAVGNWGNGTSVNGTINVTAGGNISAEITSLRTCEGPCGGPAPLGVMIGNDGWSATGATSGNITLHAGQDVTLSSSEGIFAGVGNFGKGTSVNGTINVTASGNVSLTTSIDGEDEGGEGGGLTTSAGIGNENSSNTGSAGGNVTVSADNVSLIGEGYFVQIGNDGHGQVSGAINVNATGNVYVDQDDFGTALIGNYGYNNNANGTFNVSGDVSVTANGGEGVDLTTGGEGFAQIGNDGQLSGSATGSTSGNVTVTANHGGVYLYGEGGSGPEQADGEAQIGNYGSHSASGNILVAAKGGDVDLVTVGDSSLLQIGNSGYQTNGTLSGNITITTSANLTLGANGSSAVVQIGNGQLGAQEADSGNISVNATGNITVSANAGDTWAIIGNGDADAEGTVNGNITLTSGGEINVSSGGGASAWASVGNYGEATTVNGTINITAAGDLGVDSDSQSSQAWIGNRGDNDNLTVGGDIFVTANGTGGISVQATGEGFYARIGNYVQGNGTQVSGNVTVTANQGSILLSASKNYAVVAIGNYGIGDTDPDISGNVLVAAKGGNLVLNAAGENAVVQIGNGGNAGGGTMGGNVTVSASGNLNLTSQADSAVVQIGNGSFENNGTISGNINVTVGGNMTVAALMQGENFPSYALVGNGDARGESTGSVSGDINVRANGTLSFDSFSDLNDQSGNNDVVWLGNIGGTGAGDTESGNVTIVANSETDLDAAAFGTILAADLGTSNATGGNVFVGMNGSEGKIGGVNYNSPHMLSIASGGNLNITGSIVNSGSGALNLVGGWDGHTTTAASLGNSGVYGNNNGSVNIGGNSTVHLGSKSGAITVAGANITLNAAHGAAQIGYAGSGSGNVTVLASKNIVMDAGNGADEYVQIGDGTVRSNLTETGNVTVHAGGNITVQAGNSAFAYAQIGNGGDSSNGTFGGNINVTAAGALSVLGGIDYAQIGNAGWGTHGNATGNINVNATGNITVQSGTNGNYGEAQIGHGGDMATGNYTGNISVTSGGALTLVSAPGGQYAQIGDGTGTGGGDNAASNITVHAASLTLTGSTSSAGDNQVEIGNTAVNGNATGSIAVNVSNAATVQTTSSGGNVWIGNDVLTGTGAASGALSIIVGVIDADGDHLGVIDHFIRQDVMDGPMTLGFTNASDQNDLHGLDYSSAYDLTLLTAGSLNVLGDIQNSGTGNITIVAGWNPAVAPASVSTTAGAYGRNSATVTIGGSEGTGVASVGSAHGTTTVDTDNLVVDAHNGRAQLGYRGNGGGAIVVNALGDVSVQTETDNVAQIGNGAFTANGPVGGDISVNAGTVEVTTTANDSIAQIGNIGGAGPSQSGNITVNAAGVSVASTASDTTAQIGNSEVGNGDPGVYGNASGNIQINAGFVDLATYDGNSAALIGNGSPLGYNSNTSGDIVVSASVVDIVSQGAPGTGNASQARIGSHGRTSASGNITVNASAAVNLGGGTDGNAIIGSNSLGTTTGAVKVTSNGAITLEAGEADSEVFIGHSGTNANGNISVVANGTVTLNADGADSVALIGDAGVGTFSGNVTVASTHGNVSANASGIDSFVGIGLVTEASGATATGNVTVSGTNVALTANGGEGLANIGMLSEGGVTTGNVIVTASNNLTLSSSESGLADIGPLAFGGAAAGNVTLTASAISTAGKGQVSGNTANVTVTGAGKSVGSAAAPLLLDVGSVSVHTNNGNAYLSSPDEGVSVGVGANGITLGTGNLVLSADGNITQTAAIDASSINVSASNGSIVLTNAANDFTTAVLTSTGNAALTDSTALTMSGANLTGNLTVTAKSIAQSGAIKAHSLTATASNGSIALTNASNNITTASLTATGNASLTDLGSLTISGAHAGGTVTLAAGSVGQSGAINAATLVVTASNGSIALTNTGNNITTASLTATGNASLTDATALTVSGANVGGNLTLAATSIGQTGAIKAKGLTATASNGSIALTSTANNITTASLTATGNGALYDVANLTLDHASIGGNLTLLTKDNLDFASSAQLTSGALMAVAGWDGTTTSPTALTTGTAFGINGGSITVGGTGGVAVGSKTGTTTLAADNLLLSAISGYAQVGYHGGGSGAITVHATGNVTLNGGGTTAYFAQIGDGGYKVTGSNSDAVSVLANGNITLNGGSGQEAYAQIGNGGAESNGNTHGYTDTGAITVHGKVLAMNAGSGSATYAQIGDGGYKSGESLSGTATVGGDIVINAVGNASLKGGAADAYAQIGNGGDFVNNDGANGSGGTIGGNITVAISNPVPAGNAISGTAGTGANSYVQIGDGGNGENTPATGATVHFTVGGNIIIDDLALTGSDTGSNGYALIGNGDGAQSGTGDVSGNITVSQGTTFDLTPGTAPGTSTGIQNATGTGTVSGSVSGYTNQSTTPASNPTTAGSVSTIIQNNTTPTSFTYTASSAPSFAGQTSDFSASTSSAPTPLEKLAGEAEDEDTPSDGVASSVGDSLNGGGKTHVVSKTIIPGVLDEIITLTPTHPHGVPPADVDYSSWGNEALWRW